MTLIIQKPTGAKLVLAKGYPNDPDVLAYIAAVQAADESASPGIGALEIGTVKAIDDFVTGCKSDGIWPAIKASCILAGARTLNGALIPLAGTAPTNNNFVSGDYNRKIGLVGNGSTKYLNSNRNNNADPQNSQHIAYYSTNSPENSSAVIGAGLADAGVTSILLTGNLIVLRSRTNASSDFSGLPTQFVGVSRSLSSSYTRRFSGASNVVSSTSQTPFNQNIIVFGRTTTNLGTPRLAFYSIGESLDLALLDARVTDLINAFAAAIP